MEKG
ncbi:hypothetical protein RDI58_010636 [Solanum bulbocastanum]|jgi:hypothetical protein